MAYKEDLKVKRKVLKEKLLKAIGEYPVYNGFAMTHLLSRLVGILEDKKDQIEDGLRELDTEDTGEVPIDKV